MSYQWCEDLRAMITKILRCFFTTGWFQGPRAGLQPHRQWQSEFMFFPAKRPLRDDTQPPAMTRPTIVADGRQSDFQGL